MTPVALVTEPRPLSVLVPLIKQDIAAGDEAAKQASMPYYRAAGEKMLEAKPQIAHGQFEDWVKRNFSIGVTQARVWISLARTTPRLQNDAAASPTSINEHLRSIGRDRPTSGAVRRNWQPAVDDIVARARAEQQRLAAIESLNRVQERQAENKCQLAKPKRK